MSRSAAYPAVLLHYSGKETDEAKAVILDELVRKGSVRVYWESTAPWGWDDVADVVTEDSECIATEPSEFYTAMGIGEDET